MDDYIASNRILWNNWTGIHARSKFYDLESFKAGRNSLLPLERTELGDVAGKTLLHLQCHFGMDTLSWARLGATVTGVDFSDEAINLARSLSEELAIPATFVCSNIYGLDEVLDGQWDIVFTSYGVLFWLPDLRRWAQLVARFLKPGGTFYIVEGHPFAMTLEEQHGQRLVTYPYFQGSEPLRFETKGSYADPTADYQYVEHGWHHPIGEIVTNLVQAGLRVEFLHEFPYCAWQVTESMKLAEDGWWRVPGDETQPFLFSLKATK